MDGRRRRLPTTARSAPRPRSARNDPTPAAAHVALWTVALVQPAPGTSVAVRSRTTKAPAWRAIRRSFASVPTPVYTRRWFATATFAAEATAGPDASTVV